MAAPGPDRLAIALYHGYELSGSGSNEYTRYLARALAGLGHRVVLICGEPDPAAHSFVSRAVAHGVDGEPRELFRRPGGGVVLHQLPRTSVQPVYLADKQRAGRVATFPELSDGEIAEYHAAMVATLTRVLRDERPDVLHANHLVYQPVAAAEACREVGVPFYVVPHGSAIEYTLRRDARLRRAAGDGLAAADGVVWISREVRERTRALYPELAPAIDAKSFAVGVGTDTSLFAPLAGGGRRAALAELAALAAPGGKTAEQRAELRARLATGDLEATRAYWDAYDHARPDADLPAQLARIPAEGELLIFVGSLTVGKGVQSLLAAMPGILSRRPGAHLVLVGSGTYREALEALLYALETGDAALFDALVTRGGDLDRAGLPGPLEDLRAYAARPENRRVLLAHGPRLAGRVHLLGRLDHPRLRCIFPCARLAIFPSIVKEASPLVFAEAMANGVLPAGSYHSGLRDGLDDLRPQLPEAVWRHMRLEVDPARRVGAIAESVCALLAALDREDLTPRLRRLAEQRYDWRSVAAALADAARQVVQGAQAASRRSA